MSDKTAQEWRSQIDTLQRDIKTREALIEENKIVRQQVALQVALDELPASEFYKVNERIIDLESNNSLTLLAIIEAGKHLETTERAEYSARVRDLLDQRKVVEQQRDAGYNLIDVRLTELLGEMDRVVELAYEMRSLSYEADQHGTGDNMLRTTKRNIRDYVLLRLSDKGFETDRVQGVYREQLRNMFSAAAPVGDAPVEMLEMEKVN